MRSPLRISPSVIGKILPNLSILVPAVSLRLRLANSWTLILRDYEWMLPWCVSILEVLKFSDPSWQEAKLDEPPDIDDLAQARINELESKQEELRSKLLELREFYNIARNSYNAIREVHVH
jgi:hypothetical protein